MATIIPSGLKYREGVQHKGIKRRKGDNQPGKTFMGTNGKKRTVPYNGRKYRIPTGMPGSPQGKPLSATLKV